MAARAGTRRRDPAPDFSTVTEIAGTRLTRESYAMAQTRYAIAADRAAGRDVLEVACGIGQGLGLIAGRARRVVGGDLTADFLRSAARQYGRRVPLVGLDAQALPFGPASFDLILLCEAIYYLPDAASFLRECGRVLRPGGQVLIATVNPDWPGCNPSSRSTRYWAAPDLADLLERHGFAPHLFGAFPDRPATPPGRLIAHLRRLAVRLHLIPRTMRGKAWLKRLFYGRLIEAPAELSPDPDAVAPLIPIDPAEAVRDVKILFAFGEKI